MVLGERELGNEELRSLLLVRVFGRGDDLVGGFACRGPAAELAVGRGQAHQRALAHFERGVGRRGGAVEARGGAFEVE